MHILIVKIEVFFFSYRVARSYVLHLHLFGSNQINLKFLWGLLLTGVNILLGDVGCGYWVWQYLLLVYGLFLFQREILLIGIIFILLFPHHVTRIFNTCSSHWCCCRRRWWNGFHQHCILLNYFFCKHDLLRMSCSIFSSRGCTKSCRWWCWSKLRLSIFKVIWAIANILILRTWNCGRSLIIKCTHCKLWLRLSRRFCQWLDISNDLHFLMMVIVWIRVVRI